MHARLSYVLTVLESEGGLLHRTPEYSVGCLPLRHRVQCLGFKIEEPEKPGTLDLQRAQAVGIPIGPLISELKAGRSVHLPNGRLVRPEEVLSPPRRGLSLAYCTDTVPCTNTLHLARDADLLIHEATYLDALAEKAAERGHSTAAQAARLAREAGARELLLTHFKLVYQPGD